MSSGALYWFLQFLCRQPETLAVEDLGSRERVEHLDARCIFVVDDGGDVEVELLCETIEADFSSMPGTFSAPSL